MDVLHCPTCKRSAKAGTWICKCGIRHTANGVKQRSYWEPLHYYAPTHRNEWDADKARQRYKEWQAGIPRYGCSCEANWAKLTAEYPMLFSSPAEFFERSVLLHNLVSERHVRPQPPQFSLHDSYAKYWHNLPDVLHVYRGPQPAKPEKRFQIIIKSILRWDCVERLVKSIRRWYPTVEILIGDDSFERLPDELPEAMQRTIATPGVTWFQLEYDYGLPATRNFLMRQCTAEYAVTCDDDFVFTEETRADQLADILDSDKSIGVACGLVRMDGLHAQSWHGHFEFRSVGDKMDLKIMPLTSRWHQCGEAWYRQTDLSWNFYCARRDMVLASEADPTFRICGEHLDRFLAFHRDGVRVVETPNVIIGHLDSKPAEYMKMRYRKSQFYGPMLDKWRLTTPPNHPASNVPGIPPRDVEQMLREQHRTRPNIVLLTVGHTGSSVVARMLGELGWHLADADEQYTESVSVRSANQQRDWSGAAEILAVLPEPWIIKDPRFCEHLDKWRSALEPYSTVLVWLTRGKDETAASYRRRGESERALHRRLAAAQQHWDRWTGPKLRIDYEQIQSAIANWVTAPLARLACRAQLETSNAGQPSAS